MAVPVSQVEKIKFTPQLSYEKIFHNILEGRLIKFVATYETVNNFTLLFTKTYFVGIVAAILDRKWFFW